MMAHRPEPRNQEEQVEDYRAALRQFDLRKAIVAGLDYRDDVSEEEKAAYREAIKEVEAELAARGIELGLIRTQ